MKLHLSLISQQNMWSSNSSGIKTNSDSHKAVHKPGERASESPAALSPCADCRPENLQSTKAREPASTAGPIACAERKPDAQWGHMPECNTSIYTSVLYEILYVASGTPV